MTAYTRHRDKGYFDWLLLAVVYALSIFGLLCITMATYDPSVSANVPILNKVLNSRSGMWQSIFLLVSPIVIGVVYAIPTEQFDRRARMIFLAVLALLMITLVAGQASSNLRGWLKSSILGRSIQPSEFAKLSILLMLAHHLSRSDKPMGRLRDFMRVMFIVGMPMLVILAQGETGTVIVIAFMFLVMIYFAGTDIRIILGLLAVGTIGIGFIVAYGLLSKTTDYRILRLLAFLEPQKYYETGGYQIIQSQRAIGSGQLKGIGTFVAGSWATLGYVPENSTDFIFTVVGECFGFVGCMAVLIGQAFIVIHMIYLARFTKDRFGQLVIMGVAAMLFFHVFQNIAMTMGIMPITGIPLPFMSYGGSNYISNIAAVALVLNITKNRAETTSSFTLNMPKPKPEKKKKRFLFF